LALTSDTTIEVAFGLFNEALIVAVGSLVALAVFGFALSHGHITG
jgi:hypothetical protein